MKRRGRIPKALLYELVTEARACGMGPRRLGRLIGYNHQHMSRIAVTLDLPRREREHQGPVVWTDKLVELVQRAATVDIKCHRRCENCGSLIGGTLRPQETEAA